MVSEKVTLFTFVPVPAFQMVRELGLSMTASRSWAGPCKAGMGEGGRDREDRTWWKCTSSGISHMERDVHTVACD